jgi:hypothetical protein
MGYGLDAAITPLPKHPNELGEAILQLSASDRMKIEGAA